MKSFVETFEWIIVFCFMAALCFVFDGDPDLWDKWHTHAMEQGCAAPPSGPE